MAPGAGCWGVLGLRGGWSKFFQAEVLLLCGSSARVARALATLTGLGVQGRKWEQDGGREARELGKGMVNTWPGLNPGLGVNARPPIEALRRERGREELYKGVSREQN